MELEVKRSRVVRGAQGFFTEFWKFAAKGNAIQLAIAVVIGGAFGGIVNSLVTDIITPLLSILTGNVDFSTWAYTIRPERMVDGALDPALVIGYGKLLQATLNFLIIGISIFLLFKLFSGVIERLRSRAEEEEKAAPPEPVSTEEKLLSEIRDLLKEQTNRQQ